MAGGNHSEQVPPGGEKRGAVERRETRADLAQRHIEDPSAFEPTDVRSKGVLVFIGGLMLAVSLVCGVVVFLFRSFHTVREPVEPFPVPRESQVPPEPRLEVRGERDLRSFRAQEDRVLQTYGWADREAGVVRIPIERAMDLIARRGLPARGAKPPK